MQRTLKDLSEVLRSGQRYSQHVLHTSTMQGFHSTFFHDLSRAITHHMAVHLSPMAPCHFLSSDRLRSVELSSQTWWNKSLTT